MSDLIRKIGELTVNATIDYNDKVAALEAADRKYLQAYGAADKARVEARDAALTARDAAVNAAWDAYHAAIAAADAKFSETVDVLDAEIEPFQKAEEAAKLNFDKARAAWAAIVDDVAVGGLDEEEDDGEEIELLSEGEAQAEAEVQAEEVGYAVEAEEAETIYEGELGVWSEPAPVVEAIQEVSPGPSDETQGAASTEEVTSTITEVVNDPQPAPFPEVTITGTLTVGDTVAEPAPAGEVGGVEPPVVEPSVGEGSGEPVAAPVTGFDPLSAGIPEQGTTTVDATPPAPPVEAVPEAPATFPVEYADVPVPLVEDLPLDGTVAVTDETKPA